jgi:REP element-mobilizing transposase RayT
MPVNNKYLAHFECGNTYHIYNKTNNKELLFRTEENYIYFLKQFSKYISPFADTYAWNLLPNHFHFMIRVKMLDNILDHINKLPLLKQTKSEKNFLIGNDVNALMEMEFKRFFTSYAMAFNGMFNRTGNLFYRTFKRVEITHDEQFTQALIYIHANAQKHKLVKQFDKYKWESYHTVISGKPTKLLRNEIIDWFGSKDEFIKVQHALTEYYYGFSGSIEDDDDKD